MSKGNNRSEFVFCGLHEVYPAEKESALGTSCSQDHKGIHFKSMLATSDFDLYATPINMAISLFSPDGRDYYNYFKNRNTSVPRFT